MQHIVVGTAGHIDHGKTSLVRALTGHDTDTLREEKERKITIDLGFAFLGDGVTIIDVPGHERFIKNMVTGAATVDFVVLVVAADDGLMPQTREHFDILRLLGVQHGMIALTKIDMVDEDWLDLVEEELASFVEGSFLEGAPICRIDSISGHGVDDFRESLLNRLAELPPTQGRGVFRLFVDRAFSVKGHGMVVTGTVLSGVLQPGNDVEIQPGGHHAKVRQLQVHGETTTEVKSGDRAAINLQGLSKEDVARGSVLAPLGLLKPGPLLDVQLRLLPQAPPLKHRDRLRVHIGTSEVMGRVVLLGQSTLQPGQSSFAQLQLEEPVSALVNDSFVLRRYSPQLTIGGGHVLDPQPLPHKPGSRGVVKRLESMTQENEVGLLIGLLLSPNKFLWSLADLQERTGSTQSDLELSLSQLINDQRAVHVELGSRRLYLAQETMSTLKTRLLSLLGTFHEATPELPGMRSAQLRSELMPSSRWSSQELPLFDRMIESLATDGHLQHGEGLIWLCDHVVRVPETLRQRMEDALVILKKAAFKAPKPSDLAQEMKISSFEIRRVLALCRNENRVCQITSEIQLITELYDEALEKLRALDSGSAEGFTVSQAGEILGGASRRFTVPFLEHLDDKNVTRRDGNFRRFL
jgi:selenocysteine-specific elongation factor